jgi:molybdopterin-guanine dinucleotide biosynthesis protein B
VRWTFTKPPLLGLAARSGTGKTTLLEALLPMLRERGLCVGVIKHSHHDFEIDQPGKDSYRLRKAGARQLVLASAYRTALIEERQPPHEPCLERILPRLDLDALDLILVEGFRDEPFPKIELHRGARTRPLLHKQDGSIIAIASDRPLADLSLPRLDLDQPGQILEFILDFVATTKTGARQ